MQQENITLLPISDTLQ